MPVLPFTENPVVILSEKLSSQINFLHAKVGSIEWSGVLLYSHKEGDISDPDNMVILAEEIYLMNIGSAGYTEYTNDVDSVLDMFDKYPRLESGELKQGHIHSHHSLGSTSFSGTDMQELQDNAPAHNYYLSLIVDFKCRPTAKIATICEVEERKISHRGSSGKIQKQMSSEERLGIYECITSPELEQGFLDRFSIIQKLKKEEDEKKKVKNKKYNGRMGSWNGNKRYSDIPQNVKGWDPHGSNGYEDPFDEMRDLFFDPDFSEKAIGQFIYKWFNMNAHGATGGLDEAVDQMTVWINEAPKEAVPEFSQLLIDSFENFAMDIVGEGYGLTNDEYLKLVKIIIDLLEPHEDNKVINNVIDELLQYQEMLESEIEALKNE